MCGLLCWPARPCVVALVGLTPPAPEAHLQTYAIHTAAHKATHVVMLNVQRMNRHSRCVQQSLSQIDRSHLHTTHLPARANHAIALPPSLSCKTTSQKHQLEALADSALTGLAASSLSLPACHARLAGKPLVLHHTLATRPIVLHSPSSTALLSLLPCAGLCLLFQLSLGPAGTPSHPHQPASLLHNTTQTQTETQRGESHSGAQSGARRPDPNTPGHASTCQHVDQPLATRLLAGICSCGTRSTCHCRDLVSVSVFKLCQHCTAASHYFACTPGGG